ncbi:MAG: hypothetical protein N3E47_04460 [Candidatus Bathyarchaeota archaeon]|nr:hypothetical protein [Candidatus Bathyarchaeota archaeon]
MLKSNFCELMVLAALLNLKPKNSLRFNPISKIVERRVINFNESIIVGEKVYNVNEDL